MTTYCSVWIVIIYLAGLQQMGIYIISNSLLSQTTV